MSAQHNVRAMTSSALKFRESRSLSDFGEVKMGAGELFAFTLSPIGEWRWRPQSGQPMLGHPLSNRRVLFVVRYFDRFGARKRAGQKRGKLKKATLSDGCCRFRLAPIFLRISEWFRQGVLNQEVYERLLADIDARLPWLESGEEELADCRGSRNPQHRKNRHYETQYRSDSL